MLFKTQHPLFVWSRECTERFRFPVQALLCGESRKQEFFCQVPWPAPCKHEVAAARWALPAPRLLPLAHLPFVVAQDHQMKKPGQTKAGSGVSHLATSAPIFWRT